MSRGARVTWAAVAGCLAIAAHSVVSFTAANAMWVGRDAPAEWVFYYVEAGCLLFPVTVTTGRLLTRSRRTRHIGGLLVGVAAVTAAAWGEAVTGYAPLWISEGWTGNGWS